MKKYLALTAFAAVGIAVCVSAVAAGPAAASTTLGQSSPIRSNTTCSIGEYVQAGQEDPSVTYRVPSPGGVITRWSTGGRLGTASATAYLRLWRPTSDPDRLTLVGSYPSTLPAGPGPFSFASRIPVSGGEILGYRLYSGSSYCTVNANSPLEGWRYVNTFNPWHSGDTAGFAPEASGTRFAIGAVMEADADGDGYGDETQDLCPTSASTQASCPPVAATHAATDVAQTSAVLHGTLQPNGAATTYRFDYGEGAYTWQTPDVVVPASTEQRHVSATVSGLKPDTTYHFRLSASNDEGAVQGGDLTLTTARTPDTAPPETLITDGPLPLARDTNARLHFTSEAGTSFECKLDSGDWNPCSSPTSYTSLPDGEHLFLVHATDQAGNTDPTPAMRAWTVETAAPSPTTDAPSATTDAPPTAGDTSPSTGGGTGQDALSWPPSPAEVRAPTQRRVLALLRDASLTAPPRGAVKPADIGNGAPGINLSTGRVSAGTLTAVKKLQVGITYIANLPEAGTHAGATRNLILGTRTLQLNTGQIRALTVKLTGSTRKRLRKFDNLRVKCVLRLTDESGVTRTTIRITKLSVVGRP